MGKYTVSAASAAAAAGAAYAALRTASSQRIYITEIGFTLNAATASSVGLIRPATIGTASTSTLGQAVDPADPASTVNLDTAWSAAPTIGSIYLRRIVLPATIGAGWIWTFQRGELVVGVSGSASSILLWNFGGAAGSAMSVYFNWEE